MAFALNFRGKTLSSTSFFSPQLYLVDSLKILEIEIQEIQHDLS